MKKYFTLIICCLLLSSKAHLQPTLNSTCGFQDGSMIQIYFVSHPDLNEGNSGISQTWDFSSLSDDVQATIYTGADVSLTPFAYDFPMADVASMGTDLSGNDIYSYFTNDDAHYTTWGYETYSDKLEYSNSRDILHFPFTYGDSFTDSYYATLLVGFNVGTVDISADGYGTLILPTGTFNDCLRVKEIRHDTMASGPTPVYTNDTSYRFYVVNYPEPLCQVNHHHTSDGFTFDEIYWQNVSPNVVTEIPNENVISVFPNPCSDQLTITIPAPDNNSRLNIYDASGRNVIIDFAVESSTLQLSTAGLTNGIYFIALQTSGKRYLESFVVEQD